MFKVIRFRFRLTPSACIELQPLVMLRPKYGLPMVLHQRIDLLD